MNAQTTHQNQSSCWCSEPWWYLFICRWVCQLWKESFSEVNELRWKVRLTAPGTGVITIRPVTLTLLLFVANRLNDEDGLASVGSSRLPCAWIFCTFHSRHWVPRRQVQQNSCVNYKNKTTAAVMNVHFSNRTILHDSFKNIHWKPLDFIIFRNMDYFCLWLQLANVLIHPLYCYFNTNMEEIFFPSTCMTSCPYMVTLSICRRTLARHIL